MPHIARFHEQRRMDTQPQPKRPEPRNSRDTKALTEPLECPDCLCWEGHHRNGSCTKCGCQRTSLDE